MSEFALAETYLWNWGACMRRGWNPELDLPRIEICYKMAAPSGGEYEEPEYITHVNAAVNSLPDLNKNLIEGHYRYDIKIKALSKHFNLSYGKCREELKVGEGAVYGHLKAVGVIRG